MFKERTPRLLLTLALMTTAAPAVASDFRGFFTMFMATPLLMFVSLVIGSILIRRSTLSRPGPLRYIPAVMLLIALPPLAFLSVFALPFAVSYAVIAMSALTALWAWAAWNFWRHPHGRTAAYSARVLGVIVVAAAGVIVLDMYNAIDDSRDLMNAIWMLIALAGLITLALHVCIQVGLRGVASSSAVVEQTVAD